MAPHRALTIKEVCEALNLKRRTFFSLKRAGKLPMVEELKPRLGRLVRYRPDLIER
jgi:excisionase family DNA binding protein